MLSVHESNGTMQARLRMDAEYVAAIDQILTTMRGEDKWGKPKMKLDTARELLLKDGVQPGEGADTYLVHSSSDPDKQYRVTPKGCTCDAGQRGSKNCTHQAAVEVFTRWHTQRWTSQVPQGQGEPLRSNAALAVENAPGSTQPPQTSQQTGIADNMEPGASQTPPTPSPDAAHLAAQKHRIVVLLNQCGVKARTREEYAEAVMTQAGLPLAPEHYALIITRLQEIVAAQEAAPKPPTIPAKYITDVKGKQHVQFAGLLAMAHEAGLCELVAEFVSVTADLALAKAHAFFRDGRRFAESGDATPANVNPMVKPHFARMALTRAKARCLRDALCITECAVEELE